MFPIRLPLVEADLLVTPPWEHLALPLRVLLLALLVGGPLALMVWLYRYELKLVSRLTALGLLGLRLVVLVLLLLLVCLQPIYARETTRQLPGRVLVVVDRSDSMDIADPQRDFLDKLRLARALKLVRDLCPDSQFDAWVRAHQENRELENRSVLDQVLARVDGLTRGQASERVLSPDGVGLLQALAGQHDVALMGFHREPWEAPPDKLAELFAFTDLRAPLVRAQEMSGPGQGKLLGIVLLTDGQHNAGQPPARKARELGERGVPIYPVALGARRGPPDAAMVAVRGPNHAVFKDVDASIEVRFKITGLKAQDFLLELHRSGREKNLLEQRTIKHDGKDRDYTERFTVRMDEGRHADAGGQRPAGGPRHEGDAHRQQPPGNNGERGGRQGPRAARRWRGALGVPLPRHGAAARPHGRVEDGGLRPAAPRRRPG
jgi:hypothetical protein